MPLTLGDKYNPNFRGYPPHMSKEDLELWERFRLYHLPGAIALYFDVGLGGQTEVPPDTAPGQAVMWLRLTQKRIDVLVEKTESWQIVELRNNAQPSAVGRLLLYRDMWAKERPDPRPFELILVTNYSDGDVRALCDGLNIQYIIV